jgi:hypothetical protein
LVASGVAVLSLAPEAVASRPPRFRFLAEAVTYPVGDGARFVAFQLRTGRARVLDMQRGRSFVEPVPSAPDGSGPCVLSALGGEHLLWVCPSSDPAVAPGVPRENFLVQSVLTRQYESVAGAEQFVSPGSENFTQPTGIGRYWVVGLTRSIQHFGGTTTYLSWHTGQQGHEAFYPSEYRAVENPDSASLEQRLCSPLHRYVDDSVEGAPRWLEFLYDRTYGVTRTVPDGALVLWRCGRRQPRRLDRCPGPGICRSVVAGGGLVSWITLRGLRAYAPVRGRSLSWSLGHYGVPARRQSTFDGLTHTATRVFYAYTRAFNTQGPYPSPDSRPPVFIRVASLPR